jgi:hypothetical protein
MPTKTTSKKKPAARKTTAAHKPAAAKAKVAPKKKEPEHKPAAKPHPPAAKSHAEHPPAPKAAAKPAPAPRREVESVSLIDEKKPKQKSQDGEVKKKSTVLPPISRIRASMEAASAPPKPTAPPPEPPKTEAPKVDVDLAMEPAALPAEEEEPENVIHIKPPIIVKHLASELGLKPHQVIAELMAFNIFANVNQTIEPDIAVRLRRPMDSFWKKSGAKKAAAFTR